MANTVSNPDTLSNPQNPPASPPSQNIWDKIKQTANEAYVQWIVKQAADEAAAQWTLWQAAVEVAVVTNPTQQLGTFDLPKPEEVKKQVKGLEDILKDISDVDPEVSLGLAEAASAILIASRNETDLIASVMKVTTPDTAIDVLFALAEDELSEQVQNALSSIMPSRLNDPDVFARISALEVPDSPEGRLQAAQSFYSVYGGGPDYGYGRGQIDFTLWEIERGALANSPWWKAVNGQLMQDMQEARLLREHNLIGIGGSNPAVAAWLAYFADPTPKTWYAAHNTSITIGYRENEELARQETFEEQVLISSVLTRVLMAEAMVNSPFSLDMANPSGMDLGNLGTFHAVDLATSFPPDFSRVSYFPAIYPSQYPVPESIANDVLGLYLVEHDIAGLQGESLLSTLLYPPSSNTNSNNRISIISVSEYARGINPSQYANVTPGEVRKRYLANMGAGGLNIPRSLTDTILTGIEDAWPF